jgi:hypothetical protein
MCTCTHFGRSEVLIGKTASRVELLQERCNGNRIYKKGVICILHFFSFGSTVQFRPRPPPWNFRFTSVTRYSTVDRTPWTGDQLIARPLPAHTTQTQTLNIHAQSGIQTHCSGVRASEDSSCLRLLVYRDRLRTLNKSQKCDFTITIRIYA